MAKNASVPMEWLLGTLDKRVSQGVALRDMFLCVPYYEEAEFEFEISSVFNTKWRSQGNYLLRDYPNLAKILGHSRKESSIRVFFIHFSRLAKNIILNHKKYQYPRVSNIDNASKGILLPYARPN